MSYQQDSMPQVLGALSGMVATKTTPRGNGPTVRARTVDGITIVEILDVENLFAAEAIADLATQLRCLVDAGHTRMMLDFHGVRAMSSDVLGTLAGLHRRLEKLGGRLYLYRAAPVLRDMLRVCRLDRVFDVYPLESD